MPDREQVIKGLECEEYSEYARCNQCPYVQFHKCKTLLMRDALALLKEPQKKPQQIEMEGGGSTWWYVCPECHGAIDRQDHFCRHCGQAVED